MNFKMGSLYSHSSESISESSIDKSSSNDGVIKKNKCVNSKIECEILKKVVTGQNRRDKATLEYLRECCNVEIATNQEPNKW